MKQVHELIETLDKIEQLLELQGLEALKMDIPEIRELVFSLDSLKTSPHSDEIVVVFTPYQFKLLSKEISRLKSIKL